MGFFLERAFITISFLSQAYCLTIDIQASNVIFIGSVLPNSGGKHTFNFPITALVKLHYLCSVVIRNNISVFCIQSTEMLHVQVESIVTWIALLIIGMVLNSLFTRFTRPSNVPGQSMTQLPPSLVSVAPGRAPPTFTKPIATTSAGTDEW